jgi:hypothetical protein
VYNIVQGEELAEKVEMALKDNSVVPVKHSDAVPEIDCTAYASLFFDPDSKESKTKKKKEKKNKKEKNNRT